MTKPIVMFDIGAVLLELTYGRFHSNLRSRGLDDNVIKKYAALELSELTGKISKGNFLPLAKLVLDEKDEMSESDLVSLISSAHGKPVDDMIYLKRHISNKGYSVGLMSNIGPYSHETLEHKCPEIFDTFGGPKIFSYLVGAAKPDMKMFSSLSKEYSPVFYIDDNRSYLAAAETLGWNGIHFTPYIDKSELVRSVQTYNTESSSKIKVANSFADVVNFLNDAGIKM